MPTKRIFHHVECVQTPVCVQAITVEFVRHLESGNFFPLEGSTGIRSRTRNRCDFLGHLFGCVPWADHPSESRYDALRWFSSVRPRRNVRNHVLVATEGFAVSSFDEFVLSPHNSLINSVDPGRHHGRFDSPRGDHSMWVECFGGAFGNGMVVAFARSLRSVGGGA